MRVCRFGEAAWVKKKGDRACVSLCVCVCVYKLSVCVCVSVCLCLTRRAFSCDKAGVVFFLRACVFFEGRCFFGGLCFF